MTAPRTVASATRRLVALTALRWLPVGLLSPVLVLLAQARGLSLSQVGLLFVVHGVVVVVLELPTGGLADALGRRPVLAAAAVLHLSSCALLLVATDLGGFALAVLLKAVGRSLDTGPLEAWYVDTVQVLDRQADIARGLAWRGAADGGGLALGAALGGALPALVAAGGVDALRVPVAVAAVLDAGYLALLAPLMTELRAPSGRPAARALWHGFAGVPATVVATLRLSARDPALRVLLVISALIGVALAGLELVGPVHFAQLAGSADAGAAVFGVVLAASFGAAALGSAAAPALRGAVGGSTRAACAVVTALGAVGVGVLAGASATAVAAAAFAVFYLGNGAAWPFLHALSHDRVSSAQRATMVSALSLAVGIGGIAGSGGLPRIAEAAGASAAFATTAAVAALTAALCLRLPGTVPPATRPVGQRSARRPAARTRLR